MQRVEKLKYLKLSLLFLFPVVTVIVVTTGPVDISITNFLTRALNSEHDQHSYILFQLRIPRVLAAIMVGISMALCGAVLQSLFRNPLADPGLLGVTSGAALGAALAIVLLPSLRFAIEGQFIIAGSAFLMGLVAVLLVYIMGKTQFGVSTVYMLLGGIAINAIAITLVNMLQYFANDVALRDINTWLMGGLHSFSYLQLSICLMATVPFLLLLFHYARALDAVLLGESEARHLGINVELMKKSLLLSSTLSVCMLTAFSGVIGFIGLIAPHIVRLIVGPSHRQLLPLTALIGAIIMLSSDSLAKTLIKPAEIPVGLITAMIGAPFFIFLLIHYRNQHHR